MTFYRRSNKISPMSSFGHAMFAEDEESIEIYGKNLFTFTGDAVSIESIKSDIANAWECSPVISIDLTGDEVAESFNPRDIVSAAEAWDDGDLVQWFWDNIAEPMQVFAFATHDGAVVFDERLIRMENA